MKDSHFGRFFPRSPRRIRAEVDEEIAFHLAERIAELERSGMSPGDARDEAERRFGPVDVTRNVCIEHDHRREARTRMRMEWSDVTQDVRIAWRQVWRRPVFALTAVETLALGIGAATTVFSVTDHVMLRPLPYAAADRVMTVWGVDAKRGELKKEVSPGEFTAWSESSRAAETWGLAEPSGFDLTGGAHPEPVTAWKVTSGFFGALGVTPIVGGVFTADDYASASGAVVISHDLWQTRFGGEPSIVGRTIQLDAKPFVVRGVLPPDIAYPEAADVWTPRVIGADERRDYDSGYMFAVARLRSDASVERLQAEVSAASARISQLPEFHGERRGANVVPIETQVLGAVRPALTLLSAAVVFLLLIACTNVAALLIARNQERSREMAVRTVLGAGRRRLLRHMMVEAAVLALLGGALGVALAYSGTRVFTALAPADLPRAAAIRVDLRVLVFAALSTLATFIMCGLPAAIRSSRMQPGNALRGGRTVHGTRDVRRFRQLLVSIELALALVLLVGAGLLTRSFAALLSNDLGFEAEGRATVQLFLWDRNPTAEQRVARAQLLEERFARIAGVSAVGATSAAPFHPHRIAGRSAFAVVGADPNASDAQVMGIVATPHYFDALGIPLRAGRTFTRSDDATSPKVAVINETAARAYFAGVDPIGRRARFGVMDRPDERVIIGVVADMRPVSFDATPTPEVYIPHSQSGTGSLTFVVNTTADVDALLARMRQEVWAVDPDQTVYYAATLPQLLAGTLAARRFYLAVLAGFSILALTLSAVGLYGLISFSTRQRRSEIGVRLALGARSNAITLMLVREGVLLAVPGLLAGTVCALWLTRFMRGMLFSVEATDPATFGTAVVVLLVLAAFGAYLPARRAAAADPASSLRQE